MALGTWHRLVRKEIDSDQLLVSLDLINSWNRMSVHQKEGLTVCR